MGLSAEHLGVMQAMQMQQAMSPEQLHMAIASGMMPPPRMMPGMPNNPSALSQLMENHMNLQMLLRMQHAGQMASPGQVPQPGQMPHPAMGAMGPGAMGQMPM